MRGIGLFFGVQKRNDNYILEDPHPINRYGDPYKGDVTSGNAGLDGYSVLSRADPNYAGDPPNASGGGTIRRAYRGPDQSFEQ